MRINADSIENYDELVSNATARGRLIGRFKISYLRKRRKSPCVQLPRRKAHQIEINTQGVSFSRNAPIPEMITEQLLDTPAPSQSLMTFESYDIIPSWFDSNIDSSTDSDDAISSTAEFGGHPFHAVSMFLSTPQFSKTPLSWTTTHFY